MTKDLVLAILKNSDTYISGEAISKELGISRAAVNTAVKSLRDAGFVIDSVNNRGYLLKSSPDTLSYGDILAHLSKERMENVKVFDEIPSTNDYARELALSGAPDKTVVISNCQTKGKGRRGRSFASPKGVGIYLSVIFKPDCLPKDTVSVTAQTAVAMCNAINSSCNIMPKIKWVNDLIINQKKICGILTEMGIEAETGHIQYLIIGIGINANHKLSDFPKEIRDFASSIMLETENVVNRAKLAAQMIKELDILRDNMEDITAYLNEYKDLSATLNKDVKIISNEDEKIGKAIDINNDFSLKIKYPDGTIKDVSSGEVSVRGLYGYSD